MGDIIANPEAFFVETLESLGLGFIAAFILGYIAVVSIALGVAYLINVIVNWKLFRKAGERGWKSIIPIVNVYVTFRVAHARDLFWKAFRLGIYTVLLGILLGVATGLVESLPDLAGIWQIMGLVFAVLIVIVAINTLVVQIKFCVRLAKAFGYGNGFAVGLLFLPLIFRIILAFGKNKHCSKQDAYNP